MRRSGNKMFVHQAVAQFRLGRDGACAGQEMLS